MVQPPRACPITPSSFLFHLRLVGVVLALVHTPIATQALVFGAVDLLPIRAGVGDEGAMVRPPETVVSVDSASLHPGCFVSPNGFPFRFVTEDSLQFLTVSNLIV